MACTREQVLTIFRNLADTVNQNEQYLNELDSTIGDAEHGLNLKRGFGLIIERLDSFGEYEPAEMIKRVGRTLAGAGCGSGPIFYGLAITAIGNTFMKNGFEGADQVAAGLEAGLGAIKEKGGAEVGFKTMVDAIEPACHAFRARANAGGSVVECFSDAVAAAEEGMKSTANMLGRKGRGFHAGERGMGLQDPGATSAFLLLESVYETIKAF